LNSKKVEYMLMTEETSPILEDLPIFARLKYLSLGTPIENLL
jgi:hypothetical protein